MPDASVEVSDSTIYETVDVPPQYPGGEAYMLKMIAKITSHPSEAKKVRGTVWVSVVIEKDGNRSNIKIDESLHPALDKSALRTVKALPLWKPAQLNEKFVRCRIRIPVRFENR